jgi:capsid assembly protease
MAQFFSPEHTAAPNGPGMSLRLASKLCGAPLYMLPSHGEQLRHALENRAFDAPAARPDASKFIGTYDQRSRFRVTDDGIALVAIQGTLVDRGPWLGDLYGFATSYEGLTEQIQRLAADTAIKSVVLDIDSGGGMVAGLFDFTEEVAKLKKVKPVYALAANFAASAAYAIACCANEFYVTRTGEAGSIGVIMIHQSYGRMMDGAGIDTTIICEPAPKADGNPFTPLSHGARAEMASGVADAYQRFVSHVARNRSLGDDAVRATQARMFSGEKAVEAGLADGVKSVDELLAHIRKGVRAVKRPAAAARQTPKPSGAKTVSSEQTTALEAPNYDAVIAASLSAIAAAMPKGGAAAEPPAAAPAAPVAQAEPPAPVAADPKERIKAILNSAAGKKMPGLASHIALETDMDLATAEAVMTKAAAEQAPAAGSQTTRIYEAVAASGGNPRVAHSGTDGSAVSSLVSGMKARFAQKGA